MRYLQNVKEIEKIDLDLKDKKILSILCSNARIALTQLSKKVALSRDAVNYRIKNYEKKGLIQGYRTVVDITKFDYNANQLFIKLNNPSKEVEQNILSKLAKHPYIRAIIKFSSGFDFGVAFVTKDIDDLDRAIIKIVSDCSGFLQDYEILTISRYLTNNSLPKNFFEHDREDDKKTKATKKIDKKDIEILKLISEDAQLALYEIGTKTRMSADAVAYRIKNMLNSGIITRFIPIINYVSLDYNWHTVLMNISALDEKKEKILADFLSSDKNVLWAVKTIGRYNVMISFLVRNIEELQDSVLRLRSLFPNQINHYETLIAYEEYKYTYFPKELFS